MKKIILVGGGGHCISCIDVILSTGEFEICGILDTPEKLGTIISGIRVIGTDDDIARLVSEYENFLITIGQIKSSETRIKVFNLIRNYNGKLPSIISPRAYISPSASIDEGTIVMHNALINADATIGKLCIVNTGALVEHESNVGDFCHISTYAVVNGQVAIGKRSFVGSNAVIANNVTIPDDTTIAAGAAILKSPEVNGLYIGNPARKIS
jgi:sugar O-acyltransferase (sialic acid O-acetyltransferase NeuD family)